MSAAFGLYANPDRRGAPRHGWSAAQSFVKGRRSGLSSVASPMAWMPLGDKVCHWAVVIALIQAPNCLCERAQGCGFRRSMKTYVKTTGIWAYRYRRRFRRQDDRVHVVAEPEADRCETVHAARLSAGSSSPRVINVNGHPAYRTRRCMVSANVRSDGFARGDSVAQALYPHDLAHSLRSSG